MSRFYFCFTMFQGIASTKKGYSKTIVYNLLYHIFAGKVKPKHFYFFHK